jgi:hypothetical protein
MGKEWFTIRLSHHDSDGPVNESAASGTQCHSGDEFGVVLADVLLALRGVVYGFGGDSSEAAAHFLSAVVTAETTRPGGAWADAEMARLPEYRPARDSLLAFRDAGVTFLQELAAAHRRNDAENGRGLA